MSKITLDKSEFSKTVIKSIANVTMTVWKSKRRVHSEPGEPWVCRLDMSFFMQGVQHICGPTEEDVKTRARIFLDSCVQEIIDDVDDGSLSHETMR